MTATAEQPQIDRRAARSALSVLEIAVVRMRLALNLPGDVTSLQPAALAALLAEDDAEADQPAQLIASAAD